MNKSKVSFLNKLKIFSKQIFSVNIFDNHRVIYIFGIHIRSKIKNIKPEETVITSYGLNQEDRKVKIVASLTTFPDRINIVHKTIRTLLNQTVKPDTLVLWLAESQFPKGEEELPKELLELKEFGLTIKWCEDVRSYKKIIPALKEFPEDVIITFDDDIYYDDNVIENLYNSYLRYPECISANRSVRLYTDKNTIKVLPLAYSYWIKFQEPSFLNSIIGCGGVLYPPHSLSDEVLNQERFMKIIPTQDDMWLWGMAVLNGIKIRVVSGYDMNIQTVGNSQHCGLCKINKDKKNGIGGKEGFTLMANAYPVILEKIKENGCD